MKKAIWQTIIFKVSLHKKSSFPLRISSVNVTFTEEILNGKLHFLCSVRGNVYIKMATFLCLVLNLLSSLTLERKDLAKHKFLFSLFLYCANVIQYFSSTVISIGTFFSQAVIALKHNILTCRTCHKDKKQHFFGI